MKKGETITVSPLPLKLKLAVFLYFSFVLPYLLPWQQQPHHWQFDWEVFYYPLINGEDLFP